MLEEVDAMAALHVRCWQESYAGMLDEDFLRTLDPIYRAAIWRKVVPDPRMFAEVVCAESERVGLIIAGPASPDYGKFADGEIHALYLLKAFQGQGTGKQLLRRAVAHWQGQGGNRLVAMVFSGNESARRFYAAQGGVVAGEMDFELGGKTMTEVAYVFPATCL